WAKAFPPRVHGLRVSEIADAGLVPSEFSTPVMTVHPDALAHNERTVFDWTAEQGVALAPHGKTTMAPALWQRLLEAGAWGITVATVWQASVAIDAGVSRVLIGNAVTDAAAAARLGAQLAADPDLRVICWADSVDTIALLAAAGIDPQHPLDVLVELGG